MSHELKKLLGIVPRYIKDDDRQEEIADAMNRFARAGRAIPIEWIDELREIALRRVARFLLEAARDQGKLDAEQCLELQRKSDEAEAYRRAQRDAAMLPSGRQRPAKVCEASVAYDHNEDARIAALVKCDHYHRFNSGSGHCEGCGMHKSEYDPSARDACMAFPSDGRSVSARQQLLLWAQHHLHVFGESKCVNCGLSIDEYENVEWTTLVPCPASLPEGTTEV